jgi:hypothetical protein
MGILQDLFTNKDAQDAANAQNAAITTGTTQAMGSLGTGLTDATQSYTAGLQPFQTNLTQDQAGQTAYANATGANGAAGNTAAQANFQAGPGYQFALDQGAQNVMRNKAATGQLASGGTDTDLQAQGQGLANQQWQQYIQNLQPFVGASTQNAGGVGSLYSGLANTQNSNLTNQANLQYGSQVAQGNNQASADLASQAAAKNILGLFGGASSAASGAAGAGGGSIASGIGSMASGIGTGLGNLASGMAWLG